MDICEKLIDMVSNYPLLWNKNYPDYRDLLKKTMTWEHIAEELGIDIGELF